MSASIPVVRRVLVAALALGGLVAGCGKKGPPLPPLVQLPAAPQAFSGLRQGNTVRLAVTVPGTNIDGAKPADVTRVELFALTGLPTATANDIIRRGTRVGSIPVNPPPDPDEPEGAESSADRKVPDGVDQGSSAALSETIVVPASGQDEFRSYVAVGVNRRGRRGAPSSQVSIPLVSAPAAPTVGPTVAHDETTITVTWPTVESADPARLQVYDVTAQETRLSEAAITTGQFVDRRLVFDVERCYITRQVVDVGGVALESDASPRVCLTPRDTFAPPAPTGLNAVPETGAVSLIWNPVESADLAGYIVLRAIDPSTEVVAVNSDPLTDTTFRDTVPSGARVRYVVLAVDKSGNRSPVSTPIEETVR